MHGLRAVRGSLDEFDWFWITHTERLVRSHTQEEVYVLKGFKRLVIWFIGLIGYEEG